MDGLIKSGASIGTQVERTEIADNVLISTVFLGHDLSMGRGKPLLFETMVFDDETARLEDRYSSWKEAETGHKKNCGKDTI